VGAGVKPVLRNFSDLCRSQKAGDLLKNMYSCLKSLFGVFSSKKSHLKNPFDLDLSTCRPCRALGLALEVI